MDAADRPSCPDPTDFPRRLLNRARAARDTKNHRHRDLGREDTEENMPLMVPKMAVPMVNRVLDPDTQDKIMSWALQFAVERPWMSSFLTIVALFAILPVLGLVLALLLLVSFVAFWLGVILFLFACALTVTSLFAAGAWLYCLAVVLSTRWFLNLFSGSSSPISSLGSLTSMRPGSISKPKQNRRMSGSDTERQRRGQGGSTHSPAPEKKPSAHKRDSEKKTPSTNRNETNGDSAVTDSESELPPAHAKDDDSWFDEYEARERDAKQQNGSADEDHQSYARTVNNKTQEAAKTAPNDRDKMRRDIEKSLK